MSRTKQTEKPAEPQPAMPQHEPGERNGTMPEPNQEPTALATQGGRGALPLTGVADGMERLQRLTTSLDLSTPEGRRLAFSAIQTEDAKAADRIGQKISVRDWLMHDVHLPDMATGEIGDQRRTVLILEDGSTVSMVSDAAANGLRLLCQIEKPAPWVPGLTLTIRRQKAASGRFYYVLDPR